LSLRIPQKIFAKGIKAVQNFLSTYIVISAAMLGIILGLIAVNHSIRSVSWNLWYTKN